MDKITLYTILDGESGLNIIFFKTMEILGLNITSPSLFVINIINQSPSIYVSQIENYKIWIKEEEYVVVYHIIWMHTSKDFFFLLFSKSWIKNLDAIIN